MRAGGRRSSVVPHDLLELEDRGSDGQCEFLGPVVLSAGRRHLASQWVVVGAKSPIKSAAWARADPRHAESKRPRLPKERLLDLRSVLTATAADPLRRSQADDQEVRVIKRLTCICVRPALRTPLSLARIARRCGGWSRPRRQRRGPTTHVRRRVTASSAPVRPGSGTAPHAPPGTRRCRRAVTRRRICRGAISRGPATAAFIIGTSQPSPWDSDTSAWRFGAG